MKTGCFFVLWNYSRSIRNLLFGVHSHLRFIRQAHSHLLFGQFLHGLISLIMGCAPIFLWLPRLKSSHNSSRLIDLRCVLGRLYYTTENFFLRNVCNLNMFPKWGKPFVNLFFFHRRQRSYTALITTGDMDIFTLAALKVPLIASGSLQIWQLLTPIAFLHDTVAEYVPQFTIYV